MFEQKQIIVNGLVLNYLMRSANGDVSPIIVFLHGWRSSSAAWLPILPSFRGFRIYAFDFPGFGKSQVPPDTFDFDDYVKTIREAMRMLKIQSCILVGHSFGGRVAIALAAQYPETVQKLVLAGASGIRTRAGFKRIVAACAHALKPLFSLPFFSLLRAPLYRAIGSEDYLATPYLRTVFVRVVRYDVRPLLARVRAPALLVWGRKDSETPLSAGRIMEREIPGAKLVVLARAGHMSFMDQPKEFVSAVLDFIA